MNAEFFALAFTAALNPKLLAVDLLLIENRRPRIMFLCVLLGGMTVGITIGLLDVLTIHADTINAQKTVSAGVDLALGLLLLAVGALVATGRLHGRAGHQVTPLEWQVEQQTRGDEVEPELQRNQPVPTGDGQSAEPEQEKKDSWATRALSEPRLGVAMVVGALIGLPGAAYLTALHNLVAGHYSTATQVVAVVVFVVIEFLLIIVPYVFLELRPEATKAFLKNAQNWLAGHVHQLIAYICTILGAYLAVSALVRLA